MVFEINKEGVLYKFADITDVPGIQRLITKGFLTWETATFGVFRKFKNPDKIAIDIGAWIGATCIWLSKNFKEVICVEADNVAVKALEKNLEASECSNFKIINKAIFSSNTTITFGPNKFRESQLSDSMSQIKVNKTSDSDYECLTITLKDLLKDIDPYSIGLIKVDIEGGEEHILSDLIETSNTYNIPIFVSFHYSWWNNKDLLRFENELKSVKILTEQFQLIENKIDYIKTHPFGSVILLGRV